MEDIIKYNINSLKESIIEVKKEYPDIDSNPDSHDGSYEFVREIIEQYKREIDNSSKWDDKDVDALYFATTFVTNDIKIKKIDESNLINKESLKQIPQSIHNKKYTNNIDKVKNFGMFKNVIGKCRKTPEDSQNFIKFCTEIIDENDKNVIYGKFANLCNILSDNNMSIGILSQILHCLKPKVFPILNGPGLTFFQKALDIKMQSENGREILISNKFKEYIKVIKSIREVTDDFEFENYRILDIIAQKYYFDFDDINKYFTECAGTQSKNRPENEKDKCTAGHNNFKLITNKINNDDFECYVHQWNNGKTANPYFWAEYKSNKFKELPYSISLFAENNANKDMFFRISIECKGDENPVFIKWMPETLPGFDDFGNNTSKLTKVFNGPFEYANSKYIMEQIQEAFDKLEPKYSELCNIALGNILPTGTPAEDSKDGELMQNFSLNQILYGPPGTGKTYNTVLKAMSIIDNTEYKDVDDDKYQELKERFDVLKKEHRIEFVTFHQSYSYEDFVEGIKPYISKWNDEDPEDVKYVGQNGIFKKICHLAKTQKYTNGKNDYKFNNLSLYKILIPDSALFEYCLENSCIAMNWGEDIDFSECTTIEDIKKAVPLTFENRKQCISQVNLFKLWIDKDIKAGKDVIVIIPNSLTGIKAVGQIIGDYQYNENVENGNQQRKVRWLKTNINIDSIDIYNSKFVAPTITGMYPEKFNKENLLKLLNDNEQTKTNNYVLIIDEINRGDVSKIFGELITLIEEDKRIGNKYATTATLPYSKEQFGVPNNLYIIGTMNTADRSIALLDTALRRRFDFEEMMPRPELLKNKVVEGINLQKLLENINKRITKDYDKDHQIGHSYLMGVETKEQLERAYKNRILPLLNEYFYDDSNKVATILNCKNEELKKDYIYILGKAQKEQNDNN